MLRIRWDFPAVGTSTMSWELHWESGTQETPGTALMTIIVGSWDYGANPTIPIPQGEILAIQFGSMNNQFITWNGHDALSAGWAYSVNNPLFAGIHGAIQGAAILPSGGIVISDVVGVKLQ